MPKNTLRGIVIIIALILLFLYFIAPSFLSFVPLLVVIAFVGFTIKFTVDGIKLKNTLLNDIYPIKAEMLNALKNNKILSHQQDKINRLALIENTCSDNQKLQQWEKNKRYYQSLPNLLLALGLLGTFLGITMNLIILSRNIGDEITLQKTLSAIIGSMGIAFFSSLISLTCSFFITKFHPSYDLDIEKDKLLVFLEHELDNILFIEKDKIDLLIKTIETYSNNLSRFVNSLPENTRNFQNAVTAACNTLNTSANNFQTVVTQSSLAMQTGANVLINATNSLAGLTTTYSDITKTLEKSTISLDKATSELHSYTQQNQGIGDALLENSSEIQNLIQTNQQNLTDISGKIVQNTQTLSVATQDFNTNTYKITTALNQHTGQIVTHNDKLQNIAVVLQATTQSFNNDISQVIATLNQHTSIGENHNQNLQNVAKQIEQYSEVVGRIQANFK
ncbi:MAG: hypothetical protein HEQ19_23895 [Gloeotrichia echinulata CP02]